VELLTLTIQNKINAEEKSSFTFEDAMDFVGVEKVALA